MFEFNYAAGATFWGTWGMWLLVFAGLFIANELTRRYKKVAILTFIVLPIVLSILWFTVLRDKTYTDWFHVAKVYSALAGTMGFWLIRNLNGKKKEKGREKKWRLADYKWVLWFPPIILAVNILEAVARDIQVGLQYSGGGILADATMYVVGGPWNFMNAIAGILNIITITGWVGIVIRKKMKKDGSMDMLWPDMLWFWIIAYDLWNFAYTYNCIPGHSWYAGFALLVAPTICAFTIGKGAWLQHRAQTLALWCMFAQTFPVFIDTGKFAVASTYNTGWLFAVSFIALLSNIAVFGYMVYKVRKTKRNPYLGELYVDLKEYKSIKALS